LPKGERAIPDTMSVDRMTPEKGYTKGNIVLCCHIANKAKGRMNIDEFYIFCKTACVNIGKLK